MFYEFLSSYKNTTRSLREPDKAVEILVSRLSAYLVPIIETRYVFSILKMLSLSGGRRGVKIAFITPHMYLGLL